MNKNLFASLILIIFVFVQVFFFDNFEFKLGIIFLPILYFLWKGDEKSIVFLSFLLFIFYDFFNNNFVSYPLLIFLTLNFAIDQFSKLWGRGLILLLKFFGVFILYYSYYLGILSYNFFYNLLIIFALEVLRRVIKGGYFRFN